MATIAESTSEAVKNVIASETTSIMAQLSTEQRGALEAKFMLLPIEVRSMLVAKFPAMDFATVYAVRQLTKEANSRLASEQRPLWLRKLATYGEVLRLAPQDKHAETELRDLAESIDGAESKKILKAYTIQFVMRYNKTKNDPHIQTLCGIFGISNANLL